MRIALGCLLVVVLAYPVIVNADEGGQQAPQSQEVGRAPESRAFLAGVDTGGAIALGNCNPGYACPAKCDCILDIAACYYKPVGECLVDFCAEFGCFPVP